MKLRIAFVTLALSLAPAFAVAEGCQHGKQAMSCTTGSSYDANTGTCVVDATT
ncbi:MAG: hypothetical protein WA790_11755 [Sulfitobacter sp.]